MGEYRNHPLQIAHLDTTPFCSVQVHPSSGPHQGDGLPAGVKREAGPGGLPNLAGDDRLWRCKQGERLTHCDQEPFLSIVRTVEVYHMLTS